MGTPSPTDRVSLLTHLIPVGHLSPKDGPPSISQGLPFRFSPARSWPSSAAKPRQLRLSSNSRILPHFPRFDPPTPTTDAGGLRQPTTHHVLPLAWFLCWPGGSENETEFESRRVQVLHWRLRVLEPTTGRTYCTKQLTRPRPQRTAALSIITGDQVLAESLQSPANVIRIPEWATVLRQWDTIATNRILHAKPYQLERETRTSPYTSCFAGRISVVRFSALLV